MANTPDESKVVSLADPRDARGNVVSPAAVGEARRDMKRLLAFSLERFIYGLPHTRPEGRNYERRDGGIRFLFSSHMDDGVPFGHDRLLT